MYKRLLVHSAFEEYDVLIDRTTVWGNRFWEFGASQGDPVENKVAAHVIQVVEDLKANKITLIDLAQLRGKVLGCHCCTPRQPDAPCHGRNLIAYAEVAHKTLMEKGISYPGCIVRFKDDYRWLSNMSQLRVAVQYGGVAAYSVETTYQMSKLDPSKFESRAEYNQLIAKLEVMKGSEIKKLMKTDGEYAKYFRDDWSTYRLECMWSLIWQKFNLTEYQDKLRAVPEGTVFIEGNWWGDDFWGHCLKTSQGINLMGMMYGKLRSLLTETGIEYDTWGSYIGVDLSNGNPDKTITQTVKGGE